MAKNKTTKEDKYWGEKALMAIQGGFENPDETDKWVTHLRESITAHLKTET